MEWRRSSGLSYTRQIGVIMLCNGNLSRFVYQASILNTFTTQIDNDDDVLEYLAKDLGRVAVLPTIFDAECKLGRLLLQAKFPFLASKTTLMHDLISPADHNNILANPTPDDFANLFEKTILEKDGMTFDTNDLDSYCRASSFIVSVGESCILEDCSFPIARKYGINDLQWYI